MNNLVKRSTDWLIRVFIEEQDLPERVTDMETRKKYAYLEAWVSILGNLLLSITKVMLGILTNSVSLMADAVHSASDILTSIVVLIGFKLSSSPADEKHPYGHGRLEFVASLIISMMLMLTGIEFGKTAYFRFMENTVVKGSFWALGITLAGVVFKEWMAQFSMDLGRRADSSALHADAWHHRSDAITSILVAIAIVASKFGYNRVDAVFGIGVSAFVFYVGILIAMESASKLIGEVPSDEELQIIEDLALSVLGVTYPHGIKIHDYGAYKEISLHILVDKTLSLVEAHDISERVEKAIEKELHSKVIVHVEPEPKAGFGVNLTP